MRLFFKSEKNIKTNYKGEKVEEEPLIRISDTYNISSINLLEWKKQRKKFQHSSKNKYFE